MTLTDQDVRALDRDLLFGIERAVVVGSDFPDRIDARAFSGPVTLVGGAGNDTLLGGPAATAWPAGPGTIPCSAGRGRRVRFRRQLPGNDTVDGAAGGRDRVNLFGLTGPVAFRLDSAAAQPVPGGSVTLTNPAAVDGLVGTPYADTLTAGAGGDTLVGAGGEDHLVGGVGLDLIQAGVTQVVYLDFDSFRSAGDRAYTQADRDAVQARLEADYTPFGYKFAQARPAGGTYTTVLFNKVPFTVGGVDQSGGISDEVDWRGLNLGGTVSVDVNGFLGYTTRQLAPTVDNLVALSATVAAHELGHMAGLRHADAFGPVGSGVYLPANTADFRPAYPGPTAAADTPLHILSARRPPGRT